jgi:hypothetical protein
MRSKAHPGIRVTRRAAASRRGAVEFCLVCGVNHPAGLESPWPRPQRTAPRSPRQIRHLHFLSGGLAQHESFDLKPDAPEEIRGEFRPIDPHSGHRDL